ncbi:MAG TPA: hypothetical protein VLH77_00915, partial [Gammaproteobacteria bacterium]|nr:hypothetical protein [Gammaproteobacteria bacterium]
FSRRWTALRYGRHGAIYNVLDGRLRQREIFFLITPLNRFRFGYMCRAVQQGFPGFGFGGIDGCIVFPFVELGPPGFGLATGFGCCVTAIIVFIF